MKILNKFESGLLLSVASLLVLSACTPPNPDSTPIKPTSSPIPALVSPDSTVEAKVTASPIPETPTPVTQELLKYSANGTLLSPDGKFSASISDLIRNQAGIESVSLKNPENLIKMRKYMLVTWLGEMAKDTQTVKSNPGLEKFVGMTYDKPLETLLNAFDQNTKFISNVEFNFGNGVKGKFDRIDIKTTGSEKEWQAAVNTAIKTKTNEEVAYNIVRGPDEHTLKSLMYIKNNTLYIFTSSEFAQNRDIIKYLNSGNYLLGTLFSLPQLNGQLAIANIIGTNSMGGSHPFFEILDCTNCKRDNQESGDFIITLKK